MPAMLEVPASNTQVRNASHMRVLCTGDGETLPADMRRVQ